MRNIMSRVRMCFNWQAKSLQVLSRQKLYLSMIESYEEVIEIRQNLVDSCLAEMTFKDHLFGEKKKELARQKQELADAQATREKHIQTFRELKEEFQRLEAQEPADRMGDLMEIAAEDPANLRELSYMNARLCFISTEAELMDLDSTLGNIAFELENKSTYGGADEEAVEKDYAKAMGLAKECGPYLETFEAEVDHGRIPGRPLYHGHHPPVFREEGPDRCPDRSGHHGGNHRSPDGRVRIKREVRTHGPDECLLPAGTGPADPAEFPPEDQRGSARCALCPAGSPGGPDAVFRQSEVFPG